jgi:hypothetical protein
LKTQTQLYAEFIGSLSDDALIKIATTSFPQEIRVMLLAAPLSLKKPIIDDFFRGGKRQKDSEVVTV